TILISKCTASSRLVLSAFCAASGNGFVKKWCNFACCFMADEIFDQLSKLRILPLIIIDNADRANELAAILVANGLPVAEVVFRTSSAESTIQAIAKRGDVLVGAGTILSVEQADRAIDAGAQFLISPGTNSKVVEHVLRRGLPIVAGVATPSEIENA